MSDMAPSSRWIRAGLAAGLAGLLAAVGYLGGVPRAPSLAMPCGFHAATGLPCLFCGGTRAAGAVLSGRWSRALYLNPLSFPAVAATALVAAVLLTEAALGRTLIHWEGGFPLVRRFWPALLAAALAWWGFHMVSALSGPKTELVNLKNPVASKLRTLLPGPPR